MDEKLAFAIEASRDEEQDRQLSRVLDITGLPDLGDSALRGDVDLEIGFEAERDALVREALAA